ncbi:ExbD/TolR family protein [Nitrosomonas eutropha]|uniref:Outer membrane transport energization protein ExbD n=2 Tax=Nitrosomonas eutropha TaxID=916 RepID=A0ABX5M8Z6_9PROT|nr:biopolymer transporter ExbD [Nitrosomonas eutropha]ABI59860.1 outer membrane transport energization protein ExbD [Nitrosomonas eutropha C91]PXV83549.1 outer membrane transport energization protein ExbD [Nitrosomonas eutropha]SEI60089.1 outer membrane transport energization protein ExbD [Nitrosomonas eutropha]
MAFGDSTRYQSKTAMTEINVVPLVDVMLVLLIIFMITAPLLTHSVKVDLPKASSTLNQTQPEHIEFAIHADGSFYWGGEPVTLDQLPARFAEAVKQSDKTELHIRADRDTHYELVTKVMSIAATAGLARIGFVTDPTENQP